MSKSRQLLSALALLSAPYTTLHAAYWSPHVGADYKYWGMQTTYENKYIFPRLNNAASFYVGTRINGYFGVDVGYEQSENKKITKVYEGGEIVFAAPELPNNSTRIDLRLHDFFGYMNFYWEVVEDFELIFLMGAAYIYPDSHVMHLSVLDGNWVEYRNQTDPYWSGRFGFAAQYNPICCLGIKGSIIFDQVRRTYYFGWDENDLQYDIQPYQKATTFQIGLVYSFTNPRRNQ